MNTITTREIKIDDNKIIAKIIRDVLIQLGVPKIGTAFADIQLDRMYETYQQPQSKYFVVELNGSIVGGAGIAPLENGEPSVCELQKMYLLEAARGKGIGTNLISICLDFAKKVGFEQCYLETMPYMETAQKLYKNNGFEYLCNPMGNTGHTSCQIWMLKNL